VGQVHHCFHCSSCCCSHLFHCCCSRLSRKSVQGSISSSSPLAQTALNYLMVTELLEVRVLASDSHHLQVLNLRHCSQGCQGQRLASETASSSHICLNLSIPFWAFLRLQWYQSHPELRCQEGRRRFQSCCRNHS
jgi:hypothetical protein